MLIKVKVARPFAYAADGIHGADLSVGDEVEIDGAHIEGLCAAGLVERKTEAPSLAPTPAEPDDDGEVDEPVSPKRRRRTAPSPGEV
ncbi:hypothetical protein [Xanthobacter autotrophicus]|uniref:hypothetical protein n=1 Tax=Xanthobacter autotrophicus TaxID=280 RepID=UPI003726A1B1